MNAEEGASLYVPDYCIQGERIPFYIIWDKNVKNQITITMPSGIVLAELFNTSTDDLQIDKNVCIVHNTEINGYVGGVFKSKMYDRASIVKKIKFKIQNKQNNQQFVEKNVELFRPDVQFDDSIKSINIRSTKRSKLIVDGNIKIFNCGKGTAIVKIKIMPDSEIEESQPQGFEEFKLKFLNDFGDALLDLKKKFPEYNKMLDSLQSVLENPLSTSIERGAVRKTINDLENACNNNEQFFRDFTRLVATVYFKNMSIITDADSFLAFLKSTGKNKLLVLDAMKVFKIRHKTQILRAELHTTDLASNTYPPKKLRPIKITADVSCDIPFYQIIDFAGGIKWR